MTDIKNKGGAMVLIVDDNPVNRRLMSRLLTRQGYGICEAADGSEALQQAAHMHPNLIISDILMPAMDGFEFVRRSRDDPQLRDIQVILYTAHYREHEVQALAEQCQVARVFIKPCEPADIMDAVDQILRQPTSVAPAAERHEQFDRQHLAVITNKLAQKSHDLEVADASLMRQLQNHEALLQRESEQRERATYQLSQSEERFRQLAENIQDVFLSLTPMASLRTSARRTKRSGERLTSSIRTHGLSLCIRRTWTR